ncbi:hypothetical protein, partial [Hyphomicrobium sp.]|uniref:hypothetical protein n=1 Tax=Hyphomicrobium sp. TaxID=82 RepID=UPI002FE1C106
GVVVYKVKPGALCGRCATPTFILVYTFIILPAAILYYSTTFILLRLYLPLPTHAIRASLLRQLRIFHIA